MSSLSSACHATFSLLTGVLEVTKARTPSTNGLFAITLFVTMLAPRCEESSRIIFVMNEINISKKNPVSTHKKIRFLLLLKN
jgi:hypothetical protein